MVRRTFAIYRSRNVNAVLTMKTKEEIEKMSDSERRVKTAELCDWKEIKLDGFRYGGFPSMEEEKFIEGPCGRWRTAASFYTLPDYLNDLNAMTEAERYLPSVRLLSYYESLALVDGHGEGPMLIFSTARQRNTAFLMVML